MNTQSRERPAETHEEFLQRAGQVFPVEASLGWTVLERTVFNHLVGNLVFRHGYAGITDAMLQRASGEMHEIVGRLRPRLTH